MTFFHFVNCAALSVGPHLVLQRLEASGARPALSGAAAFFFTQLVRITLLPSSSSLSVTARLCDLLGLVLAVLLLSPRNPRSVAIAWALMDSVSTNCFKLYRLIGAFEFDANAFHHAVHASPYLFAALAVVIALGTYRRPSSRSLPALVTLLLSAGAFVANPLLSANDRASLPRSLLSAALLSLVALALLAMAVLGEQRAKKKRA